METSALIPVNNMGIVALSAVSAGIIFKEKFTAVNWLGILLALAAIAMIAFSK
jgi:multidrug transporter EmrE-like cation transporter